VPAAQPGHWLRLVTRLGRLGCISVGLDPAPKKKKKVDRVWALGPAGANYVC